MPQLSLSCSLYLECGVHIPIAKLRRDFPIYTVQTPQRKQRQFFIVHPVHHCTFSLRVRKWRARGMLKCVCLAPRCSRPTMCYLCHVLP